MTKAHRSLPSAGPSEPTESELDWIDQRVKSFERNWKVGDPSRLTEYVSDAGVLRQPLLVELVHADLEFAYRHGQEVALDNYLRQFPELAMQSEAVAKLILRELELRRVHNPGLTLEEMLTRYPSLHAAFQPGALLPGTDHDQVASSDSRQTPTEVPEPIAPTEMVFPELPGYEFLSVLGQGGMGVVYRAFDTQLKRHVAIKMSLKGALATPKELARFRREAEAAAALQHPQVLQVYQIGEYQGQLYLVLEFAPGGNLSRMLNGRPIEAHQAARLMYGLAQAVAAAHLCGILHRDLKPSNVLIDSHGVLKVADFGLAKQLAVEPGQTKTDTLTFTPSYAAPESIFDPDRSTSVMVDIYSLGAILFEMLTGRPPFVGTSILEVLEQVLFGDIIAPRRLISSVPRDLETICLKCLERDPNNRYASAANLADDLDRFLNGQPVVARPITGSVRLVRWVRRNPVMASLFATVFALLCGVTASSLGIALVLAKSTEVERELRSLAQRAQQDAEESEREARAEADAVTEATKLIQELFAATDYLRLSANQADLANEPPVTGIPTREIVELTISRLKDTLKEHPKARAMVLSAVGITAVNVGLIKEASPVLHEALDLYRANGQGETVSAAEVMIALAQIEAFKREFESAAELYEQSAEVLSHLSLPDSLVHANLAVSRTWMGLTSKNRGYVNDRLDESARAVEIRRKRLGNQHPQTILAQAIHTLAQAYAAQDRSLSIDAMESLWESIRDVPLGDFLKGIVLDQLASVYQRIGNSERATMYINQSLERMNLALGNHDHPILADILTDAAWIAHVRGNIYQARLYRERALRMFERCVGDTPETRDLRDRLIEDLYNLGEYSESKRLLSQTPTASIDGLRRKQKRDVDELLRQNRLAEAREIQRSVLADVDATEFGPAIEFHTYKLAGIEAQLGNYKEALALYDRWLERAQTIPEVKRVQTLLPLPWYDVLERCSDHQRAALSREKWKQLLDNHREDLPRFHPDDWAGIYHLILAVGEMPDSMEVLTRWHQGWLSRVYPKHACMGAISYSIALQAFRTGDLEKARKYITESISILTESIGELADRKLAVELLGARICIAGGEGIEALAPLRASLAKYRDVNGPEHPAYKGLQANLDELINSIKFDSVTPTGVEPSHLRE